MSTSTLSSEIKLFYRTSDPSTPLALCRSGESLHLRRISFKNQLPLSDTDSSPVVATVSVVVEQDPFPGFTMDGKQMIWVKNYGENSGLLQELENARFVQSVGRTIKQGFISFPLCILLLSEKEILQTCEFKNCRTVEGEGGGGGQDDQGVRFKRCGKCKRRYYHQSLDWSNHKRDCKDLVKMDFVSVENRKRSREIEGLEEGGNRFRNVDRDSALEDQKFV
ncbi:hypothetical protein JCM3765_006351 [Sporobolomyces pararoseus]